MKLIKPNLKIKTTRFKPVNFPPYMSTELAEFIGIHFGDGSIFVKKGTHTISYCFNMKETELIEHTKYIFKNLFKRDLKVIQIRKCAITMTCISKPLSYFLKINFLLPFGKKNHLTIPDNIKSSSEYMKSFLKGLHWTDGCTFIKTDKKYSYPIVKITTKIEPFAKEIQQELIDLGFRATVGMKKGFNYVGYDVVLHGKEQYEKWLSEISDKKKIKYGDAAIRTRI